MTTTWLQVRGTLIHRCVLHPANKWLDIAEDWQRSRYCDQVAWMADELGKALREGDERTARALIDCGGPGWCTALADFQTLSAQDQADALDGLVEQAADAASVLVAQAVNDKWTAMLSEVSDPYARLEGAEGAGIRMDLLVERGNGAPLVVDLKTGLDPRTSGSLFVEVSAVADKYVRPLADRLGRAVVGTVLWSPKTGSAVFGKHQRRPLTASETA